MPDGARCCCLIQGVFAAIYGYVTRRAGGAAEATSSPVGGLIVVVCSTSRQPRRGTHSGCWYGQASATSASTSTSGSSRPRSPWPWVCCGSCCRPSASVTRSSTNSLGPANLPINSMGVRTSGGLAMANEALGSDAPATTILSRQWVVQACWYGEGRGSI